MKTTVPKAKPRATPKSKEPDTATELKTLIGKFHEIKLEETQLRRDLEKDVSAWASTKANFDRLAEITNEHGEQISGLGDVVQEFKEEFAVAIINPKKLTEMKKTANFYSHVGRLLNVFNKTVPELSSELSRIKRLKAATEEDEIPKASAKRARKTKS